MWNVEVTDEFAAWAELLDEADHDSIVASIMILEKHGPALGRPHVDTVKGSRHANMKELRTQSRGQPLWSFFCFDPQRSAIPLIGRNKPRRTLLRNHDPTRRRVVRHAPERTSKGRVDLMAGHTHWRRALTKNMSPERLAKAEAAANQMMTDMVLAELRKLAGLTQTELAKAVGVSQPMIAQLEHADTDDIQISTLTRIVQAVGGRLDIVVTLPDKKTIRLSQFAG